MRYRKDLSAPAFTARTVKLEGCSAFREREDALVAEKCVQFRPDGDAFVCGEGGKILTEATGIFRLMRGMDGVVGYGDGKIYCFYGEKTEIGATETPNAVVEWKDADGVPRTYAVSDRKIVRLDAGGVTEIEGAAGGVCAAVHYERLFTASGDRVRYSRALAPEDWTEAAQGAGYVDLPSEDGAIVAMVSYKEKLYLFRERGIMQLRVLGDNLNFKAASMPYSCGKLYPRTVVNCGKRVLFLTDRGLYAFNGAGCVRLGGSGFSSLDLSADMVAANVGDRYYLAATSEGRRRILSYDEQTETGYFIRAGAKELASDGKTLYYTAEGKLCRLTERGFPEGERAACTLESCRSSFGLSGERKFLDGITLSGEGFFRVTATGETCERAAGRAGEKLRFSAPVRGSSFRLRIESGSEGVCLRGITLNMREENAYGY